MKHGRFSLLSALSALVVAAAFTGCIDEGYDLTDIDTTSQLKIKELTLPINIDEITLSNLIDLDEDGLLKEINGEYVFYKEGDFSSDAINVNTVEVSAPSPSSVDINVYDHQATPVLPPGAHLSVDQQLVSYDIQEAAKTTFKYDDSNISKSIKAINSVKVQWTVRINVSADDPTNIFEWFRFNNLVLEYPEGLKVSETSHVHAIDATHATVFLDELNASNGKQVYVDLDVEAIDVTKLTKAQWEFTPSTGANKDKPGILKFNGDVSLTSGQVIAASNPNIENTPASVKISVTTNPGKITIKEFTGALYHSIDNFSVEDVQIDDLPDVLTQEGTSIRLANPQVYITINNPLGAFGATASAGFTVIPKGEEGLRQPCTLPEQIIIPGTSEGPFKYCMAPDPSAITFYKDDKVNYTGAKALPYPDLKNILYSPTNGLPTSLSVQFLEPEVNSDVHNFVLGINDPNRKVNGSYVVYFPLALGAGSKIEYSDTQMGWGSEELDKMQLNKVKISADITNDLPISVTLSGYPVDANGKQLRDVNTGKPVTINPVTIKGSQTAPAVLEADGAITGLDGMYFKAVVSQCNENALRPTDCIKLNNVRVTVSGSYLFDLSATDDNEVYDDDDDDYFDFGF